MQADLCVSFLGWRLYYSRSLSLLGCGTAYIVDFKFPRAPAGIPSGRPRSSGRDRASTAGVVRVPRRRFQRLLSERPTPERSFEADYFQRTRFEGIAERKLRGRQLTEDGNVEISGRDRR
jgi:hypothetical protein